MGEKKKSQFRTTNKSNLDKLARKTGQCDVCGKAESSWAIRWKILSDIYLEIYLIKLTKSQCLGPIHMDIVQLINSFQWSRLHSTITTVIVIFISLS